MRRILQSIKPSANSAYNVFSKMKSSISQDCALPYIICVPIAMIVVFAIPSDQSRMLESLFLVQLAVVD